MKNLRLVTILVFAVCVFSLVMAQSDLSKPKEWTYEGDNGATVEHRTGIGFRITEQPNGGYLVSGVYTYRGDDHSLPWCVIRGSYLPKGQRVRADCYKGETIVYQITGNKVQDEDQFNVTVTDTDGKEIDQIKTKLKSTKSADSSGVRVVDEFGNLVGIIASKPADSASSGAGDETPKAKGQPCCEYDVGGGDWRCSSDYNKSQCEGGMGFKGTYFADGKSCVAPFPNSINGHCK
jgi:hypothetical protein